MSDFNSVVIFGHLTGDPKLKRDPSGEPVCSFRILTKRKVVKQDGGKEESDVRMDVVVHRRLAEICAQFLKKGREVLVMGSLRQRRTAGAKQPRLDIQIVANTIQFLGGK